MCKTKGVFARFAVSVLLAFAMASAMFGGGYALFARAEEQAPTEVMTDPVFKQITMNTISGKEDSVKLMSDDTVHFVMHPTAGVGARATAAELGDGYRFDVKDGVTVVLQDRKSVV